jgi:hypothetical protein
VGNLREHDYDFARVWRTAKAQQLRRSIKAGECYCPLANAAYTNMLTHGPTLLKVAAEVARSRRPFGPAVRAAEPSAATAPMEATVGPAQHPGENVDAAAG